MSSGYLRDVYKMGAGDIWQEIEVRLDFGRTSL
jgi:hypothetical protein